MKYVLDASVAARWVLRDPLQAKALKLRAEYQQNIHELIAPSHFRFPVAVSDASQKRSSLLRFCEASLTARRFSTAL
jgi:hypothetical protein